MKFDNLLNMIIGRPQLVELRYLHRVCTVLQNRTPIHLPNVDLGEDWEASQKMFKRPQIVSLESFRAGWSLEAGDSHPVPENEKPTAAEPGVAIIPVMGSLSQRGGAMNADSSVMRGYNNIKNDIYTSMQREDVGAISLLMDGPGGAQAGNDALVRWITDTKAQFEKPIWAFVDESAYSAHYNIAATADRIVTTPSGGVGSIGCVMAHTDRSGALDDAGIRVTYIYSGDRKIDGVGTQPLSERAHKDAQRECDSYRDMFAQTVADNRPGLTFKQVVDTEAGCYVGRDAVEAGLVDDLMSEEDYYAELFELVREGDPTTVEGSEIDAAEPQPLSESEATMSKESDKGAGDTHQERYKTLCSHAAFAKNVDTVLDMAAGEIPVELCIKTLDTIAAADKRAEDAELKVAELESAPEAPAEVEAETDEFTTKFAELAATSGMSMQQKSVLQLLAPMLGSPDVPASTHDFLDGNKGDGPDAPGGKVNHNLNKADDLVASYGSLYSEDGNK